MRDESWVPSVYCGRGISIDGFAFGTGGGVLVLFLVRGAPSLGSGGSVKLRRGLGDLTGVTEVLTTEGAAGVCVGVTGRFRSNRLTREVVGGMGVSSVGLSRGAAFTTGCEPLLSLRLRSCWTAAFFSWIGLCCSNLASTLPTLPDGGSTSRSLASRSLSMTGDLAGVAGGRGL